LGIAKSQVKHFNSSFSAKVDNAPLNSAKISHGDLTLLGLFEITNRNIDSIYISFNASSELCLTYQFDGQKITKTYTGYFSRRKYYQIYTKKQKIEIPPLLPIIYNNTHVNRLRIALTIDGLLIVDNMWDNGGSIFFFGAGASGRRQILFNVRETNCVGLTPPKQ
jgi:hypothetical protein